MIRLASLAALIFLWQIGAWVSDPRRLPGPLAVFDAIVKEAQSGALFSNLAVTLARVLASFLLAMSLGAAIGYVMGRRRLVDRLLEALPAAMRPGGRPPREASRGSPDGHRRGFANRGDADR